MRCCHNTKLVNLFNVLHDLNVLVQLEVVDLPRVLVQVVEERRIIVVERVVGTTDFVRVHVGTQSTAQGEIIIRDRP